MVKPPGPARRRLAPLWTSSWRTKAPPSSTSKISTSHCVNLRRFTQWLVEIFEVEDGGAFVRHDEVQSGARRLRAGPGGFTIVTHPLGEAPGPDGHRRGTRQPETHLTQNHSHPLLFGRANVGERPSGLEDLANHL